MRLYIDNLDGSGPRNYTAYLRQGRGPVVLRKLNRPDELEFLLAGESGSMLVPNAGARVELVRADGSKIFTGYISSAPEVACLGVEERGPWNAYTVRATGDEYLLNRRPLETRPAYAGVAAGALLRDLAEELCPGVFNTDGISDSSEVTSVSCGGSRTWGDIAQQVSANTRSSYRVHDRFVRFGTVGAIVYTLREKDIEGRDLKIGATAPIVNDATVLGPGEPAAYVKDQFVGDGLNLRFSLSNYPFLSTPRTVLEEEFSGSLRPHIWVTADPGLKLTVSGGRLSSSGGSGNASECFVALRQQAELGGAWQFQHGELSLDSGSGYVGGIFDGTVDPAHCLAAFLVADSSGQRTIRPFINGALAGSTVTVRDGCRYALSTRVYASESFRLRPTFFSSAHPLGSGIGGGALDANIRVVLECREIDPSNPASLVQPAIVLFEDIVQDVPATAMYVPLASETLVGSLNFVRIRRMPDVLVRTAVPNQPYRTRLVGALSEGAECTISSAGSLYFYSMLPPYSNEAIEVSYRTSARSAGRAVDKGSMEELARLMDDGVRGTVAALDGPAARCSEDCALAAQAWLEDSARAGWSGEYTCWSDALPDAAPDIFPGDTIHVEAPSRDADFTAIVREVRIEAVDPQEGREHVLIRFADDAAQPIALQLGREQSGYDWPNIVVDASEPASLPAVNNAAITALTSTTMTIDAGTGTPAGGGFEVRRSDAAWGPDNDRNLAGRFTMRVFTLPRLARNQQYCIRQYDGSMPPRYSRHTTILYVDKPL